MQDIISQPAMHLGKLAEYGEAALDYLVQQRRVFNRMDWWTPYEWLESDAFCAVSSLNGVDAAVLSVPVSLDQIRRLHSAHSRTAWLRWCAVTDGVSASEALRPLLQFNAEELLLAGIEEVYAIVEPTHWITTYLLREGHYRRVDDVITMINRRPTNVQMMQPQPAGVTVRPAVYEDLEEVCAVDHSAFDEQWQYPLFVLKRAMDTCAYFSVAIQGGRTIGYQFATADGQDAHITRLAVRAELQGHGIGAILLENALFTLREEMHARLITLNTQMSNQISQRLYWRFGFQALAPLMHVLCRRLSENTSH
ncbi:MAG TPA: GNAT family N-acetyltransferase [Anaerolineae bacterium]